MSINGMWNCPGCGDYRLPCETVCHHCGVPRPPVAPPTPLPPKTEMPRTESDFARERHRRRVEAERDRQRRAA